MSHKSLSSREERRYKSQIALKEIGEKGQEKIKNSRVLIIGAGGKGNMALTNLITAGVGKIGICDDRIINEESLSKQCLYGDNDIGKQKAIVSKQYLQSRNQFTSIKVHNILLSPENLNKIIHDYDVLIDATNDFETHFSIADAAFEAQIPLVFGSIIKNKTLVKVLNVTNKQTLGEIFKDQTPIDVGEEDGATPIVITNSITGVILANETIKIILNQPSQLCDNLLIINTSDYSLTIKPV